MRSQISNLDSSISRQMAAIYKQTIPSICKPQELVCNFYLLKMLVLPKCRFREELFSLLANEDFT